MCFNFLNYRYTDLLLFSCLWFLCGLIRNFDFCERKKKEIGEWDHGTCGRKKKQTLVGQTFQNNITLQLVKKYIKQQTFSLHTLLHTFIILSAT